MELGNHAGDYHGGPVKGCDRVVHRCRPYKAVQEAANGRRAHRHEAHADGVERYGVGRLRFSHHARDHRLSCGHLKCEHCPLEYGCDQQVYPGDHSDGDQYRQDRGQNGAACLCPLNYRPPFEPVADRAAKEGQDEHGGGESKCYYAGQYGLSGQVVDQYPASGHLHLHAAHGEHKPDPQHAEIPVSKSFERPGKAGINADRRSRRKVGFANR